ncbi:peptidoglycan-binding protein [bacterium]|nr:MAG: peptidoglycan-binding protein [bacterium]
MVKKLLILVVLLGFALTLTSCATAKKPKDLQMQGLRNQISVLESQLQDKADEINSLKESLSKASQEETKASAGLKSKKVVGEVKSRPNAKQIQMALKNAGYDPGTIDGKMGRQTKEAIRAFQRANNLYADGRVGKKTWKLLRKYLYQKVK